MDATTMTAEVAKTRRQNRRGLGQAKPLLAGQDGSVWIWNIKEDRWQEALGRLDFYQNPFGNSPGQGTGPTGKCPFSQNLQDACPHAALQAGFQTGSQASGHLWAVARALHPDQEESARTCTSM